MSFADSQQMFLHYLIIHMLRGQSVLGQKHILHKYANTNLNASALTIHTGKICNFPVAVKKSHS